MKESIVIYFAPLLGGGILMLTVRRFPKGGDQKPKWAILALILFSVVTALAGVALLIVQVALRERIAVELTVMEIQLACLHVFLRTRLRKQRDR